MKLFLNLTFSFLILLLLSLATTAQAQTIQFDLQGQAGSGLLPGNEAPTPVVGTATGGEVGEGIFYDAASMMLTINVAWGSGNGFSDLTGDSIAMHLHGAEGGSQTTASGVLIGLNSLSGFDASSTDGGFSGSVALNASQEAIVLNGESYLNIHTDANGGGELRANLVQVSAVPEPSSLTLMALAGMAGLIRRRR